MPKTIVTSHDQLNRVSIVTKIWQDNYVIDRIDEVYVEKWNWVIMTNWTESSL